VCRSWDCLCEECAGQIGVTCRRKNNPQNQWTVYTFTDHTCDHVARSKVSSYNGKYGPTKRSCVSTKVVTDKVSEHFTVPLMVSTKARALKDATKEKLGVDVPLRQAYRIKQETRARATFDTDYQLLDTYLRLVRTVFLLFFSSFFFLSHCTYCRAPTRS
jgi:hypothetical protein